MTLRIFVNFVISSNHHLLRTYFPFEVLVNYLWFLSHTRRPWVLDFDDCSSFFVNFCEKLPLKKKTKKISFKFFHTCLLTDYNKKFEHFFFFESDLNSELVVSHEDFKTKLRNNSIKFVGFIKMFLRCHIRDWRFE